MPIRVKLKQEAGGTVSYFQAGGIDRPLVIWKSGVGSVVTHQNWRGQFARGTWGAGHSLVGQSSDCTATYTGQNCVPVPWPGWNTGAWFQEAAKPQTVGSERYWLGSQSVEMRDASGLMYKRNRYYNPQTGQFTQPDPVGLAGGLNIYGFAAGDPVSYSDPYGLKVCFKGSASEVGALRSAAEGVTGAAIYLDEQNCISSVGTPMVENLRGLRNRLEFLHRRPETYDVAFMFTESGFNSRCDNPVSHFCDLDLSVTIDQTQIRNRLDAPEYFGCTIFGPFQTQPAGFGWGNPVGHSGETVLAHELLGHAWAHAAGLRDDESVGIRAENVFRTREPGGRAKCGG